MHHDVAALLDDVPIGVLATLRADGTPRQSAVYFVVDGDTVYVSTERGRRKADDVARTGRASLCVVGRSAPFPSVTLEGPARVRDTDIAAVTRRIFVRMSGGEPPELTEEGLAAMNRVVIEIEVVRTYGRSYLEQSQPGKATV